MSREIKFRSWNGSSMDYDVSLNDHCIMQYTGLKDKNGVEIYEGDILSVLELNNKLLESVMLVKFEDFGFVLEDLKRDKIGDSWLCILKEESTPLTEFELTGNIYENPELLNQKQ